MRNKARLKAEIRNKNGREAVEFAWRKAKNKSGVPDFRLFNELIGSYNEQRQAEEYQKTLPYRD